MADNADKAMVDGIKMVPPVIVGMTPAGHGRTGGLRKIISILLSLCLVLFLADAIVSLADDSLALLSGFHPFTVLRLATAAFAILAAMLVYFSMALTPMIPKRVFLPLTLFGIVGQLVMLPCMIYCYTRLPLLLWAMSLGQLVLGLGILYWAKSRLNFRWPLVPEERLGTRDFTWLNLIGFPLLNILVFLPVAVVYLAVCAMLAVGHFSNGFLALRPDGLKVEVKKFMRADGKIIQLVPMSHVGDAGFYQKLAESFPTNSLILMEGVTDKNNLLTNKISYKRMATTLGLSEQKKEFTPARSQMVRADVDISEFTPETIGVLNVVMRIHAQGLNRAALQDLARFQTTPKLQDQIIEDLIIKRNQHLLEEIRAYLAGADLIIVPWGAAHMPGIGRELENAGFRVMESQEYTVIHFGKAAKPDTSDKHEQR